MRSSGGLCLVTRECLSCMAAELGRAMSGAHAGVNTPLRQWELAEVLAVVSSSGGWSVGCVPGAAAVVSVVTGGREGRTGSCVHLAVGF